VQNAFERQFSEHGKASLERSQTSLRKRLVEHLQKLDKIGTAGGYTSSVEREIGNFQAQIQAIEAILAREDEGESAPPED
jgi:hypothetical protein